MKNINRVNDLTGRRFGRLTVIGMDDRDSRKTYWVCQCDCGNIKVTRSDALIGGATKSCGCLKKECDEVNLGHITHKQSNTRLYHTWQGIKKRCNNEHDSRYYRYGGRGIKICAEWENDFQAFYNWAMANGYKDNLTIDRIDNNKNYEPGNCRWANAKQQSNNRETNVNITIGNATKTLMQWCEIFELDYSIVHARYCRNGYQGIDELFNG